MEQKTYRGRMEFVSKADGDQEGAFRAEFATLSVIDLDGDVTEAGAFEDGQPTLIEAWNHNYGELPVGKGIIHEEGDKAIIEGHFFLDTEGGREHYKTVKNLGDLQEWSYTFDIVDSGMGTFEDQDVRFLRRLDVWGVAPVERGAGIATRTVDIKRRPDEKKGALASHSTATTDAAWDGPANEARARSGEDEVYYRKIFAWMDPEGDPTVKTSYKFVHHQVSEDGTPGAANVRGCQTGIGVLNGGRGGTTIPDGDRQGVWNHLARHLRDAEVEPPELKAQAIDLQELHDMLVLLGAKCPGHSSDTGGEGPSQGQAGNGEPRSKGTETLAARVALELLEARFDE